jgi:hypothetical protein
MKKSHKIIYWIATVWLSLGMTVSGMLQITKFKDEVEHMAHLGYPLYFLSIIGVWKILGVITVLMPKFPLLKEWAYAGFFFTMTGALFSHASAGDAASEYFGPALLTVLTCVSWYFRPESRTLKQTQ